MYRKWILCLGIVLISTGVSIAQEPENNGAPDAKELSGMSIVGNDEAPKSLYIVPWKSSQLGVETTLDSMLNEKDRPVDREVFKRQIEFYRIQTTMNK